MLAGVAALAVAFVVALRHWVRAAPLNADEGFYLAAAEATLRGELPYFDYAYTQGPFLPLLTAPPVALVNPSLAAIRWIGAGWTAAALIVAFVLMRGARYPLWAGAALLLLLLAPLPLSFLVIGKTYALAQLLLLGAAAALVLPWSWKVRLAWLSVFGVLAAGCRMTLAPVVVFFWAGFWWQNRESAKWPWMLGVPAAVAIALGGPFFLPDPGRFWFWNVGYHRATLADRHPTGFWLETARFAPGCWLAAAAAVGWAWRVRQADSAGAVMLVAAAAGLVLNLCLVGMFPEYATPFVLLLLVGAARVGQATPWRRWWIPAALVAAVVGVQAGWAKWPARPVFASGKPLLQQASEAADFLRRNTKPGDLVLGSMPEIALEAGRPLYRDLVLGKFAVTEELPARQAAHLKMATFKELAWGASEQEPAAIVMSVNGPLWNFIWTIPSFEVARRGGPALERAITLNYRRGFSNDVYFVLVRR